MTYGDGLADVNIKEIISNHFSSGCEATDLFNLQGGMEY